MRKTLLAANWKMHKTPQESREFIKAFQQEHSNEVQKQCIFFPANLCLEATITASKSGSTPIGIQNFYHQDSGAFTGESSPSTAKQMGAQYALIGHSERRHLFSENLEEIAKKLRKALDSGLTPMLCLGESLEDREAGKTEILLSQQLQSALKVLDSSELSKIVLAYEPVWAIGTGKVASPEQAEEAQAFIRKELESLYGPETAQTISILYGGSVKPENANELLKQKNIDGFLVGGASLEPSSFGALARICFG